MKILLVDDPRADAELIDATSVAAALDAMDHHADVDWVFLDLQLPDGTGFELLEKLSALKLSAPIIVLSARSDPATVERALNAGASGYLSKSAPPAEIIDAMQALEHSARYVARSLRPALDAYRSGFGDHAGLPSELTRRQQQILELVARGMSNREIADELSLSESTVKGHVTTLFAIFDAGSRTACAHAARQMGLID